MGLPGIVARIASSFALALAVLPGWAADYPPPKEGDWIVRDFRFHTGEILPDLRIHYTTIGAPTGEPVLVLHGTTDTIMSASDSRAISDIVNRAHPGRATYAEIQDADHLLAVHNKLEEHVVPTMIDWMKKQLGQR